MAHSRNPGGDPPVTSSRACAMPVTHMERYMNFSGNSGVTAYEIGDDSIAVEFQERTVYLYTNQSTGAANIREMQRLAIAGRGLSSFIARVVRDAYAEKLHP